MNWRKTPPDELFDGLIARWTATVKLLPGEEGQRWPQGLGMWCLSMYHTRARLVIRRPMWRGVRCGHWELSYFRPNWEARIDPTWRDARPFARYATETEIQRLAYERAVAVGGRNAIGV